MTDRDPSGPSPETFDDIHIDDAWVGDEEPSPPARRNRFLQAIASPRGILFLVLALFAAFLLFRLALDRAPAEPSELDLNAYAGLTAEGYSGHAVAVPSFDEEAFRQDLTAAYRARHPLGNRSLSEDQWEKVLSAVSFDVSPKNAIQNGDTLTLTITVGETGLEEDILLTSSGPVTVTVSGLQDPLSYDPFSDLGLFFEGVSGQGHLTLTGESPYPISYSADKTEGLSNGDTVTLTAAPSGSYDKASLLADYGVVLTREESSLVVDCLSYYAASLEDLPGEGESSLEAEVLAAVREKIWEGYAETETLEGLSLLGRCLLTSRYEAAQPVNMLFLVYEARYRHDDGTAAGYYYYGMVTDLLVQDDGSLSRGGEEIRFPEGWSGAIGLFDQGAVCRIDLFHAVTGYPSLSGLREDAIAPFETSYEVLTDIPDF